MRIGVDRVCALLGSWRGVLKFQIFAEVSRKGDGQIRSFHGTLVLCVAPSLLAVFGQIIMVPLEGWLDNLGVRDGQRKTISNAPLNLLQILCIA